MPVKYPMTSGRGTGLEIRLRPSDAYRNVPKRGGLSGFFRSRNRLLSVLVPSRATEFGSNFGSKVPGTFSWPRRRSVGGTPRAIAARKWIGHPRGRTSSTERPGPRPRRSEHLRLARWPNCRARKGARIFCPPNAATDIRRHSEALAAHPSGCRARQGPNSGPPAQLRLYRRLGRRQPVTVGKGARASSIPNH
jgi:hypothetical protein